MSMTNNNPQDYTVDFTVPSHAIDVATLKGEKLPCTQNGSTYIIKSGDVFNDITRINNNDIIYIAGELIVNNSLQFTQNNRIYILDGGKLTVNGKSEINMAGNSLVAVQYGGQFTDNGCSSLKNNNKGTVYNAGKMDINYIYLTNSTDFFNYGTARFADFESTNNATNVVNNAEMTVTNKFTLTGNAFFYNYSDFKAKTWSSNGADIFNYGQLIIAEDCIVFQAKVENNCYWESGHQVIQQGSYFKNKINSCVKAASMHFDGAVIQLYSNSI